MNIQLYNVAPSIPQPIGFLEKLACNMWWCWHEEAIELFRRINPNLWRQCEHNPQAFLNTVPQKRLEALAKDDAFLRHVKQVREHFDRDLTGPPSTRYCGEAVGCIAYFSLEYGIHESVRLYSGGLGVLAGDHLKAAADLHLPLVGVGLMYRQGYFQQYLDDQGWQQERYPENEIHELPLVLVTNDQQQPVTISVPLPDGELKAAVWRLDVGRVPLFLLDTNIPDNPPALRPITAQLYGGDSENRLRQELLLGIGGYRALLALGHEPQACHMNEGHAAFLSLARISHLMQSRELGLNEAVEINARTNIFTTHTPVPAGNETFAIDLARRYLDTVGGALGIDPKTIIRWAQPAGQAEGPEISMTILGLRMSAHNNGVSRLHGTVSAHMWQHLWPAKAEDEIPIHHVTNGVHVPSWVSPDIATVLDRYLGPEWREHPAEAGVLGRLAQVPDEELWRAHELGRSRLIRTTRELTEKQYLARNATRAEIAQAKSIFDHDTLTIGFARRFATYKRATLLLQDLERFEALPCSEDRPVQIVFAGKAHPADHHGKDFIKRIVEFSRRANVRRRVIFLENYNIYIARALTQGVDVWLNTPRRPQEASGTSGMKAAINGGLNLSVLDGWWCEGYSPECGWAIGDGTVYDDPVYQDGVEAHALYNLLENEVVPTFYDRPAGDVPTQWIKMMKASIRMGLGFFTSHRMVAQYHELGYAPALKEYASLTADGSRRAKVLVKQRARLERLWGQVKIGFPVTTADMSNIHVGDKLALTTAVQLGELKPNEVNVQVYYGPVDSRNRITASHREAMTKGEDRGSGHYEYRHEITCTHTGRYGFSTRVIPHGQDWNLVIPGFITWAHGADA